MNTTRSTADFIPLLMAFLSQATLFLVWLVGMGLALLYWRRHPAVSMLALLAFMILFLNAFIGTFLVVWLPLSMQDSGRTHQEVGALLSMIGLVRGLTVTVGYVLLLFAVFGWRKARTGSHGRGSTGASSWATDRYPGTPILRSNMNPVRKGAEVGAIIGFVLGAILTLVGGVVLIGWAVSYDEWEAVLWVAGATVLLVPLMGLFVATKGIIVGALWVMVRRRLGGKPAAADAGQASPSPAGVPLGASDGPLCNPLPSGQQEVH